MFKFVLCKIKYCKKSYLSKITLYDIWIRMEADTDAESGSAFQLMRIYITV